MLSRGDRRPTARGLLAWDLGLRRLGRPLILRSRPAGVACPHAETIAAGEHWLRMDGHEVFRRAVRVVVESSTADASAGPASPPPTSTGSCPTRPTPASSTAAASRLDIPAERCVVNIDRYGNTSAASIPIALAEAADDGRVHRRRHRARCGFGAGMTWSSAVLRWGRPIGAETRRVALVTGGSRGIGRAFAVRAGRRRPPGRRCATGPTRRARRRPSPPSATRRRGPGRRADVADPAAVDAAFNEIEATWGPVADPGQQRRRHPRRAARCA